MAAPHFPDIGTIGETPPGQAPGESLADVQSERDKAIGRADAAERALEQRAAPPPPPAMADLGPPEAGEMPDAATEPEGFQKWLGVREARTAWESKRYVDGVKSTADNENRSDRIIDDYMAAHPKYRNLREHVFRAFKQVCVEQRLTTLPDDTTALDKAVDTKMTAMVKEAAAAVDDLPTGDPKTSKDETPPGRTEGLSAGSKGASTPSPTPKEEDGVEIKSMFDVIRDNQAKSGLF